LNKTERLWACSIAPKSVFFLVVSVPVIFREDRRAHWDKFATRPIGRFTLSKAANFIGFAKFTACLKPKAKGKRDASV
jgi:hypothetical protein